MLVGQDQKMLGALLVINLAIAKQKGLLPNEANDLNTTDDELLNATELIAAIKSFLEEV